jgi:hypothetical protein
MNEYGEQKGLQEILEDLALYCARNMAQTDGIRVILPKKAVEAFNVTLNAKERIVLTGPVPEMDLDTKWTSSGCITIHVIEDNEEAIKGLV